MTSRRTHLDHEDRIRRVVAHVRAHLDEPLTPRELARVACYSPHHFHRVFKGMVGESVMGFLRRLRLERAAAELEASERPVTVLAFEAGYENHESFTRAFGAQFGLSPTEFRTRARTSAHLPAGAAPHDFEPLTGTDPAMRIEIRTLPPRRVACVRHTGPYGQCGPAWDRLNAWAAAEGLFGPGAAFLGRGHDDPEVTPPDAVRYDACITVGDDVEPGEGIAIAEIPGGEYAVARHVGPYERIGDTYAALLGRWLPGSGRELADAPCLEQYWNDPENTPAEELETDVCVLLA